MNRMSRVERNIERNHVLDILEYAIQVSTDLKKELPGMLANIETVANQRRVAQTILSQYNDNLEDNDINYSKVMRHMDNSSVVRKYNEYNDLNNEIGQMWAEFYRRRPNLNPRFVNNTRSNTSSLNSRHRRRRNRKTRKSRRSN